MKEVINGLEELKQMVETAITMAKDGEDLNPILREIAFKQMYICADHFEYILVKGSKKIEEILTNEKQETN